ncbi:MAG: type II toxin-antitoxin system RelE/ParE family toxin [Deltaproteobacteria bacterium]|nr:type II toxin-antitoxin system RelE/ParE family toxin [Deltaproteobacteria bacterium]
MRVFKTKWFGRFARKERLSDQKLAEAVREVEAGLHDGALGGGLIKKRVARAGEGKRGGYRAILVYRKGTRAVFLYRFAKSDKADLSPGELQEYQKAAQAYLRLSEADIGITLQEVDDDDEKVSQ